MTKDVRERARYGVKFQQSKVIRHNEFPLGHVTNANAFCEIAHPGLVRPITDLNGYDYFLTVSHDAQKHYLSSTLLQKQRSAPSQNYS